MAGSIASPKTAAAAVALLRRRGATRVALTGLTTAHDQRPVAIAAAGADGWFDPDAPQDGFDGVVIAEQAAFAGLMRRLEPLAARDVLIVPADADWVVEPRLRDISLMDAAWNTTPDANYVSRSALKGHYLEFGTFWGRSFFPAYHRLGGWLQGGFYAFDSFRGISMPLPDEVALTAGDFTEGAYVCNQRSFEAIAELCGVDAGRLKVIPGYFSESLVGKDPAAYGLEPKSVSVCIVDCDLYQPTLEILNFVEPLLDDGALVYFDDWRLCRASPHVGERGATLKWMAEHPQYELIDFPGDVPGEMWSWQHAWFIFQRR